MTMIILLMLMSLIGRGRRARCVANEDCEEVLTLFSPILYLLSLIPFVFLFLFLFINKSSAAVHHDHGRSCSISYRGPLRGLYSVSPLLFSPLTSPHLTSTSIPLIHNWSLFCFLSLLISSPLHFTHL